MAGAGVDPGLGVAVGAEIREDLERIAAGEEAVMEEVEAAALGRREVAGAEPVDDRLQFLVGVVVVVGVVTLGLERIDLVDVFRRPEDCAEVAREAVAVSARWLWLQLGIVDEETARIAAHASIPCVQDRCTAIEVARLGLRAEFAEPNGA